MCHHKRDPNHLLNEKHPIIFNNKKKKNDVNHPSKSYPKTHNNNKKKPPKSSHPLLINRIHRNIKRKHILTKTPSII